MTTRLRLDGTTVVDTRDGTLTPNRSILIEGDRIVGIEPAGAPPDDPAVRTVDVTGTFTVPGYNDMHVHALGPDDPSGTLALMLANGITGIRQMSGSAALLAQRRAGTLPIGPAAPELLIMPGEVLTPFNAGSVDAVTAEVRRQADDGADFIKVGVVSGTVFFAAIAAAARVGLPIVGHLQNGVDAAEASRAGFMAVEHLGPGDPIWISSSTEETALRADSAQSPGPKVPQVKLPSFLQKAVRKAVLARMRQLLVNPAARADARGVARLQRAFDTYSEAKCRALAERLVADGTWQVPTLVRLRTQQLADLPEYPADPNLRYVPQDTVRSWHKATGTFAKQSAAVRATYRAAYQRQLHLTKLFDDNGVRMLAGTDDGGWEVPGFALHQEFDELAAAGLTPLRILRMTTALAAEFLGRTDTMGRVATGMAADLVLLGANPVADVANLHRVDGVVRAGAYHSRADLDGLLARVEAGHGFLR
jgi:imidazolonepropionase-like amidohydrolase